MVWKKEGNPARPGLAGYISADASLQRTHQEVEDHADKQREYCNFVSDLRLAAKVLRDRAA
jgi:hypothetical protein